MKEECKHTVWMEDGIVKMLDQTLLPNTLKILDLNTYIETRDAIRNFNTRGAGAVGASAAYAMVQAVNEISKNYDEKRNLNYFWERLEAAKERIETARPTANALFYATDKVFRAVEYATDLKTAKMFAATAALEYAQDDAAECHTIGNNGADYLEKMVRLSPKKTINFMTHCNAGGLAFVDIDSGGSALSPMYEMKKRGYNIKVFANETRPFNQGAKLTCWELARAGIEHELVPDNHVGALMANNEVDFVIVGADRIVANGDTANKVGTSVVATCANVYNVPFFVAAPKHTFDFKTSTGEGIEIEKRSSDEVTWVEGTYQNGKRGKVRIAPKNTKARYTAFDVTKRRLITAFFTPEGVIGRNQSLENKLKK